MAELLSAFPGEHSLATVLVKLTLLLMIGWGLHASLRHSHPQWRVWLWRSVTVTVPIVVLWSVALPQWTWELAVLDSPARLSGAEPGPGGISLANETGEGAPSVPAHTMAVQPLTHNTEEPPSIALNQPLNIDPTASESHVTWAEALAVGWMLVALCLLARILILGLRACQLAGRSTPCPEHVAKTGLAVAQELSVRANVEFRLCDRFTSPFVVGVRRYVVVIPQRLLHELDAAQLRLVLLHELAHVRGRDMPWSIAVKTIQSLLWFHPLAWGISRAHRQSCEAVCDALAAETDRSSYRQFLARIALWAREARIGAPAGALLATADITWRLRQLERDNGGRPPTLRRLAAAMIVAGGAVALLSATSVALSQAPPASAPTNGTEEPPAASAPNSDASDSSPAEAAESTKTPPLSAADVADLARLQGVWQSVDGENRDSVRTRPLLMQIDGTTIAINVPPPLAYPNSFVVDADSAPKRLVFDDGDVERNQVYRFDGDRLQLCINADGGDPPADFGSGTIVTFRRLISGEQITAVRNGLAYLCQAQADDGSFGTGELKDRIGLTALCGMALANGGDLAPDDSYERIDRTVDYILSRQITRRTDRGYFKGRQVGLYDLGYAIWLLARLHGADRYRDKVHEPLHRAVDFAVNAQNDNGGWGYGRKDVDWTDLSNTVVQLRALAEARREGFEVPDECFASGVEWLATHQSDSGEFRYTEGVAGSFSCTAQALSILKDLGVEDGPVYENGWRAFDEYVEGSRRREESWFLYGNLFALDAVGTITEDSRFDWYRDVCDTLVTQQRRDGSWRPDHETMNPEYGTALACLILLPRSVLEP